MANSWKEEDLRWQTRRMRWEKSMQGRCMGGDLGSEMLIKNEIKYTPFNFNKTNSNWLFIILSHKATMNLKLLIKKMRPQTRQASALQRRLREKEEERERRRRSEELVSGGFSERVVGWVIEKMNDFVIEMSQDYMQQFRSIRQRNLEEGKHIQHKIFGGMVCHCKKLNKSF